MRFSQSFNYSSEADSFFLNQIDVIKEKQPNKRKDMAIQQENPWKLLSISLRKKIKIKTTYASSDKSNWPGISGIEIFVIHRVF